MGVAASVQFSEAKFTQQVEDTLKSIRSLDKSERITPLKGIIETLQNDMQLEGNNIIKSDLAVWRQIFEAVEDLDQDIIKDFGLCHDAIASERVDLFKFFAGRLNQTNLQEMVKSELSDAIDYCMPAFDHMCEIANMAEITRDLDPDKRKYAFHSAAMRGNLPMVNLLLYDLDPEQQIALVKSENSSGQCAAFRFAANSGHNDVAVRLLEVASTQGDRDDIISTEGHYPLEYALGSNHPGIVALILDKASPAIFEEMFDPTNANYSPERAAIAARIRESVQDRLERSPENEAVRRFISSSRVASNPQILNNLFDSTTLARIQPKDTNAERANSASHPKSASQLSPRNNQNEHN